MKLMADPKGFLARWSQRKRKAAKQNCAEGPNDSEAPQWAGLGVPSARRGANAAGPAGDAGKTIEPAFDISQLPPLESITAKTDMRPFLAPGVPVEIARAALRRVWTADPAIRDHIGLSENSWDFNVPGSMLGFGPLQMTEALKQAVNRIVQAPVEPEQRCQTKTADHLLPLERPNNLEAAPDSPAQNGDQPQNREGAAQKPTDVAVQANYARMLCRKRQGGALPDS